MPTYRPMSDSNGHYFDTYEFTSIVAHDDATDNWQGIVIYLYQGEQRTYRTDGRSMDEIVARINRMFGRTDTMPVAPAAPAAPVAPGVYRASESGWLLTATVGTTTVALYRLTDGSWSARIYCGAGIEVKRMHQATLECLTARVDRWLDVRIALPPVGWDHL